MDIQISNQDINLYITFNICGDIMFAKFQNYEIWAYNIRI
jgi:hypothetical protein